jgi:NTE family protein
VNAPLPRHAHQEDLLGRLLQSCFGELAAPELALLREQLEWVELAAGQVLMAQGQAADSMYITVSGRLRVFVQDEAGAPRRVRDLARGQVIGEMALYTGEPRSATVVAVRESVLVRLPRHGFEQLVARSSQASVAMTRQLIRRLQKQEQQHEPNERPVAMGLLPISAGVDAAAFAHRLAQALAAIGRVQLVDADAVDRALGPGAAQRAGGDERPIALLLDRLEAEADFVLLVGDDQPSAWTRRCARHCDELLLLADAAQPPALHATEQQCLLPAAAAAAPFQARAAEVLVLLHDEHCRLPAGTAAWLARRPLDDHVHLRRNHARDLARLARLQSRTGVGLVLAGGGARGFAHLGVLQALRDAGVEVDRVGGTSIGAVMAAMAAAEPPLDEAVGVLRRAFAINPTGDINLVPVISLIRGRRLRRIVSQAAFSLLGGPAAIEDLWKGFFCVATNFTQQREQVLDRGDLVTALLASTAIPGALPPVLHGGELLCDGGSFNNFPADVMQRMRGIGTVIGVDLALQQPRPLDLPELPGPWALAWDRLRPPRRRKYALPSLTSYLLGVTMLYSASRRQQARGCCDLCFNPPLHRVGMLQWNRFDKIQRQGREHAQQVLQQLPPALRRRIGAREVA